MKIQIGSKISSPRVALSALSSLCVVTVAKLATAPSVRTPSAARPSPYRAAPRPYHADKAETEPLRCSSPSHARSPSRCLARRGHRLPWLPPTPHRPFAAAPLRFSAPQTVSPHSEPTTPLPEPGRALPRPEISPCTAGLH